MSDPKHIVIAGGGTGGHLFPGVAVVEALGELHPDWTFSFVGSKRGIEARAIPKLGYPLETIDVKPLMSGGIWGKLKGAFSLPVAGAQTLGILNRLKPDLVISVGGYAAGPMTMAASVFGTKTALMEQNALPGLTNRTLAKRVDHAFVSFESTIPHFAPTPTTVVGNPVRKTIASMRDGFSYSPTDGDEFHVLVIGGSGGARSLNLGVPVALAGLPAETQKRLHVVHQAGRGRTEPAVAAYEGFEGNVDVVEFIDDMGAAYSACDLLICRAGMSTIAEVTVLGIPALFVPLPTGDGHQIANAQEVVNAEAGLMVADHEIGSDVATAAIESVIDDSARLMELAGNCRKLGRPDAAYEVAHAVEALLDL